MNVPEEVQNNENVVEETNAETSELAVVAAEEVVEERAGFSYQLANAGSTVGELKNLVNSIIKSIEKEGDVFVTFQLEILGNVDISKPKSTVSEMKSLITTMIKFLEKDEAAGNQISFKLRIESK